MSKSTFFTTLSLCILLFAACQQAPAPKPAAMQETSKPDMAAIKAEIQVLENAWEVADNARDVEAVAALYADDAISIELYKPDMAVGKAAIRKSIEEGLAKRSKGETATYETMDVFGDGNIVTETGKTTVKDANGKVAYTGKYMAIWEK